MGGPVAFGWRKSGKIACHETYTGSIGLLHHPSFYLDDSEFFRDHTRFISGQPSIPLAPSGYGLVFADFDTRRVFSRQNYSSPSRIHLGGAALDLDGGVIYEPESYRETGKLSCLSEALRLGVSPGAEGYDPVSDSFRIFPWAEIGLDLRDGFHPDALASLLRRVQGSLRGHDPARASLFSLSAVLSPPGWSYFEISEDNPRPYEALLIAMDQAGIRFSPDDASAWNSFCDDCCDGASPETPGDIILARFEAERIGSSLPKTASRRKPSL